MNIEDVTKKSRNAERFSKGELVEMLALPPDSSESYMLMAEANRISKELTGNQAEVHAQFALNLAPCPGNCSFFTGSFNPSYSGAARRISIPGTDMARLGMISELRMAQIVAVTRLDVPRTVMGNCTHEPCTLGALAGANLFWAEVGANPRDTMEKTEEGRGESVKNCRDLFREAGWSVWDRASRYYRRSG